MNLMENKYLKFDTIEFNGEPVRNITNINILPDIPKKFFGDNYQLLFKVSDNQLIENISFELYNSTSYWDILMKLNNIRNVSSLPVHYDRVLFRAEKSLAKWMDAGRLTESTNLDKQYVDTLDIINNGALVTLNKPIDSQDEIVKRKYLELLDIEVLKNEDYREIKYLSLSDMAELESSLDILKNDVKINPNIIVNSVGI